MTNFKKHLLSQRDICESMLLSTAWDKRSRIQKLYILGRGKRFGLNIYQLRAKGWHVSEQTARVRLQTWLLTNKEASEC